MEETGKSKKFFELSTVEASSPVEGRRQNGRQCKRRTLVNTASGVNGRHDSTVDDERDLEQEHRKRIKGFVQTDTIIILSFVDLLVMSWRRRG